MKQCVVKIAVSTVGCYTHIDDVIYYRSGMTPDFVTRWMWYYEYLAARVKVANPHIRVVLWHGPIEIMLDDEWHEHRRLSMLKSRYLKLKRLQSVAPINDLFGFAVAEHDECIRDVVNDIALLERDEYPIAEFPGYINKVKKYLRGEKGGKL